MNGIVTDSHSSSENRAIDKGTILVFISVVAISLISATLRHRLNRPPFAEEARIAGHLMDGDGFLSPYDASPSAPPTCLNAPLYPLMIAAAYRVAGQVFAVKVLLLINSISFGVIAAGIYRLGKFYVSRSAGLIAVGLLVIHPVMLYFATDWWDSFVALAIFVALLVAAAFQPLWRNPPRAGVWIGATMGVLSLTNASYVLAFPLLILIGLRGQKMRRKMVGIIAALAGFVVMLAPWTIRNLEVFDRFYFVRSGAGFQIWLGNQPSASGWLEGDMLRTSPSVDENERQLILQLGEPDYFDLCDQRAKLEYQNAPRDFWIRSAKRFCFIFISDPTKAYLPFPMIQNIRWKQLYVDRAALHGIVALLGLSGVWTAWRLRLRCTWIFATALLAEIPFLFSSVSDRYNLPMRVILILFSGIFLSCLIRRLRDGTWPRSQIT